MSFLTSLLGGVGSTLGTIGSAVGAGLSTVGSGLLKGASTAGSWLGTAAKDVGGSLGNTWSNIADTASTASKVKNPMTGTIGAAPQGLSIWDTLIGSNKEPGLWSTISKFMGPAKEVPTGVSGVPPKQSKYVRGMVGPYVAPPTAPSAKGTSWESIMKTLANIKEFGDKFATASAQRELAKQGSKEAAQRKWEDDVTGWYQQGDYPLY